MTNKAPNPKDPILVVDDDETVLRSIDTTLRIAGWDNVLPCSDSRIVMNILAEKPVETILLDLTMPHIGGEDLLPIIRESFDVPVIIVTGDVHVSTAVRCIQAGAFDYILKPVDEDRIIAVVTRAVAFRELKRENLALRSHFLSDISGDLDKPEAFDEIITADSKMMLVFQYVESVAGTSQPVLINGETGVGKELVAKALHRLSGLEGKFVAVNAAGLDDNVFSDTLFGHVRGAFTGADRARPGLIEQAKGGTLFLDEIGDLSPASQVKLLRLLQEGDYLPLGGDHPKKAEVRIVAATNRDLAALQEEGRFRMDLNYRIGTHRVHIPPLRERMDDIPILVDHFARQAADRLGVKKPNPPKELHELLKTYSFPGNVRELHAMIFDAVSRRKSGGISLETFKAHIALERSSKSSDTRQPKGSMITFGETLPTIKQAAHLLIEEAMRRTGGNQTAAAKMIGISQQALSKRLKPARKTR